MPVDTFVHCLSTFSALPQVFNPWLDYDPEHDIAAHAPEIRRANLRRYLAERLEATKVVLIAEAPGKNGAKFSGIAMTSERILLGKGSVSPEDVFRGEKQRTSRPELQASGFNEPTATVVWDMLVNQLKMDPRSFVLWNTFPFHPHQGEDRLSNRTPLPSEIERTQDILPALLALFPRARVVAVGQIAKRRLDQMGVPADAVRHPSMGGAAAFRTGIQALSYS